MLTPLQNNAVAEGQSCTLQLGHVNHDRRVSVCLDDHEHLAEHAAIYGGTGRGKSKLFELMLRQLIDQGRGFCLIDPHGDLAENLAAYLYNRRRKGKIPLSRFQHVVYLEPGLQTTFSLDPFTYRGLGRYHAWLEAKVDSTAQVILRKQGEADFKGKARLERWLKSVLYAAGVRIDSDGRHLPLSEALLLVEPQHPRHNDVYQSVAEHLPTSIRNNFEKLRRTKRPLDQEAWVESTINWLEPILSSQVKAILGCERPSMDVRDIIQHNGIILANLRKTTELSRDQSNVIGGLIINEILDAVETAQRSERRPFSLVIDEASRFVGHDLIAALAECRKWKLSVWLGVQDLSALRTEQLDMTSKVLSQCGVQVSFQQKNPADIDIFGQFFGYPNLDFTPLVHEVDRPDGYEWVEQTAYGHGTDRGTNWSEGRSHVATKGTTVQDNWSTALQHGHDESRGYVSGTTHRTSTEQREHVDGRPGSSSRGDDISVTGSTSQSGSDSTSETSTAGGSKGRSESLATGKDWKRGGSQSESQSMTQRMIPLTVYRKERQHQGRLVTPVDDQFHELKKELRRLERGEALVSIQSLDTFHLTVDYVDDPYADHSPLLRRAHIEKLRELIAEVQPWHFTPSLCPEADEQRILRFLHAAQSQQPRRISEHSESATVDLMREDDLTI